MTEEQKALSEQLQLLFELGYSKPEISHRYRTYLNKDEQHDLHMLDLIAVCLATGRPGDFVAAAFNKEESITLILAKNDDVLDTDNIAVTTLLSNLKAASNWTNIFPFLVQHGKANLDKRVLKLHQSFDDLYNDLETLAKGHLFGPIEDEFPHSRRYRKEAYPDGEPPADHIFVDLIRTCRDGSLFKMQNDKISIANFVRLVITAETLLRSRLFREITGKGVERLRLKRRLGKVTQYAKIQELINLVKRLPDIPFYWVNVGVGEGEFELCADPMDIVHHVIKDPKEPKVTPQVVPAITEHFPRLTRNWEQRRRINPCIHAEIRIALNIRQSLLSRPTMEYPPIDKRIPIGCSKRSCLCCVMWMDLVSFLGMSWITSGSHGKPDPNWALPGAVGERSGIATESWHRLDKSLIREIDTVLAYQLHEIDPKRINSELEGSEQVWRIIDSEENELDEFELSFARSWRHLRLHPT